MDSGDSLGRYFNNESYINDNIAFGYLVSGNGLSLTCRTGACDSISFLLI